MSRPYFFSIMAHNSIMEEEAEKYGIMEAQPPLLWPYHILKPWLSGPDWTELGLTGLAGWLVFWLTCWGRLCCGRRRQWRACCAAASLGRWGRSDRTWGSTGPAGSCRSSWSGRTAPTPLEQQPQSAQGNANTTQSMIAKSAENHTSFCFDINLPT